MDGIVSPKYGPSALVTELTTTGFWRCMSPETPPGLLGRTRLTEGTFRIASTLEGRCENGSLLSSEGRSDLLGFPWHSVIDL